MRTACSEPQRAYSPREAELGRPRLVRVDDLPVALGDASRVEGGAGNDLPGDGERRDADAIGCQVGAEHRRRRSERRLAERQGRKSWDRMIGETAPGDDDGAAPASSHG